MMTEEAYSTSDRFDVSLPAGRPADDTDSPNIAVIKGVNSLITQTSFHDRPVDPLRWVIIDNNGIAPKTVRLADEIFGTTVKRRYEPHFFPLVLFTRQSGKMNVHK